MKLQQLKYFYSACQYRNITKAAKELHISQPSITKSIRDLENEFGVTLLNRLNHGFSLTEEGEILLSQAEVLLETADQVIEIMMDLGQNRKLIRLGVPPMIGTCFFPRIYQNFKELYPEVKIATREEGSRELLTLLDKNVLDIVILPTNEISSIDYKIVNFTSVNTVFCVNKNHYLSNKKIVSFKEIAEEPLVMFQDGFYQNVLVNQLFNRLAITPNIIHTSTQLETILQFIRNNIASGFLFQNIVADSKQIVGIPTTPKINIDIGLVFKRKNQMFSDMIRFVDFIESGRGI